MFRFKTSCADRADLSRTAFSQVALIQNESVPRDNTLDYSLTDHSCIDAHYQLKMMRAMGAASLLCCSRL